MQWRMEILRFLSSFFDGGIGAERVTPRLRWIPWSESPLFLREGFRVGKRHLATRAEAPR